MMPCAASTQPSALNARCAAGKPAAITCTGNGSPITPVENGSTSWMRTPASAATPSQQVNASRIPCSPVRVAQVHLAAAQPRYLLINTGNANAGSGAQGMRDALTCCGGVAALAGVRIHEVLPFSTGVIGEPLPVQV